MDKGPLVKEAISAGAELVREFDKTFPVAAAFWLKSSDADYRYLYIASDRFDGVGTRDGYGEIVRLTKAMDNPDLDMFQVMLIGANEPTAKAAVEAFEQYPGTRAKKLWGTSFGDIFAEEVYIYPPLAHAAAA